MKGLLPWKQITDLSDIVGKTVKAAAPRDSEDAVVLFFEDNSYIRFVPYEDEYDGCYSVWIGRDPTDAWTMHELGLVSREVAQAVLDARAAERQRRFEAFEKRRLQTLLGKYGLEPLLNQGGDDSAEV